MAHAPWNAARHPAYAGDMGKIADGVRKLATKMGSSLHWPNSKPSVPKKQIDRWEGEGGAVHDDDESHG